LSAQDVIYWHVGKRRGNVLSRQANIGFSRKCVPWRYLKVHVGLLHSNKYWWHYAFLCNSKIRQLSACWLPGVNNLIVEFHLNRLEELKHGNKFNQYIFQKVHFMIQCTKYIKTPTCFGTQLPSSGSYYKKGVW